jgi:hypothetical protein
MMFNRSLLVFTAFLGGPALAAGPPVSEAERIRAHLMRVEEILRQADTSHLTPELRAARDANLHRLNRYWTEGRFPVNHDHPGRSVPHFIDSQGTACAVGQLMVDGGHAEVAARVAATDNLMRLPATGDPAVLAWVAQSGLSVAECRLIQPTYGFCDECYFAAEDRVCGEDGVKYYNPCELECYDILPCADKPAAPVCDTKGETWERACEAMCANQFEYTQGPCGSPEDIPPPDLGPEPEPAPNAEMVEPLDAGSPQPDAGSPQPDAGPPPQLDAGAPAGNDTGAPGTPTPGVAVPAAGQNPGCGAGDAPRGIPAALLAGLALLGFVILGVRRLRNRPRLSAASQHVRFHK